MGKAEHLNKYFATISNLQEKDINLPLLHKQSNSTINSIQLSEDEIKDIIKNIPINKATGPDKISHKLLKHICLSVAKPITILFSMSLTESVYPTKWKLAHVLPLFKKGDKTITFNYRPISLISCVGKLFERAVFKHISNYCSINCSININLVSRLATQQFIHY